MNDDRTASFFKEIAAEKPKPKLANMNLRVDADLKYLVDTWTTHTREDIRDYVMRVLWRDLALRMDRRLVLDDALRDKLESQLMALDADAPASQPASPIEPQRPGGLASKAARLLSPED